jgi:hypothetical protein
VLAVSEQDLAPNHSRQEARGFLNESPRTSWKIVANFRDQRRNGLRIKDREVRDVSFSKTSSVRESERMRRL